MAEKVPLSVVIITKNEEGNIKECLESVRWANEIVVADKNLINKQFFKDE